MMNGSKKSIKNYVLLLRVEGIMKFKYIVVNILLMSNVHCLIASDANKAKLLTTKKCDKCTLVGVNVQKADLNNAVITRSNLQKAQFNKAALSGADFSESSCVDTDFSDADLQNANFTDTTISGARFNAAKLERANFTNAGGHGVLFVRANLTGAIFDGADLPGIDLTGANLTNASFKGVTGSIDPMSGEKRPLNLEWLANASGATLCNTTLPNGEVAHPTCKKIMEK